MDGQTVRMAALVDSDGIEHTRLYDDRCPGAFFVVVTGSRDRITDLFELKRVLFGAQRGTFDREVSATVEGVIRWRGRDRPSAIELITATDITVLPKAK